MNSGYAMKILAAVAISALLLVSNPAVGAVIDLSTWTCEKFQAAPKDDVGIILAWLDGYYREESDPAVIDTEKFVANAKKLGAYCSANPSVGLITAMDAVFKK